MESLRRRWEVLGIEKRDEKHAEVEEEEIVESEDARRKIMDGAIVQTVLENATKGRIPISP